MGKKHPIGFRFEKLQGSPEELNAYYASAEHIIHLSAQLLLAEKILRLLLHEQGPARKVDILTDLANFKDQVKKWDVSPGLERLKSELLSAHDDYIKFLQGSSKHQKGR